MAKKRYIVGLMSWKTIVYDTHLKKRAAGTRHYKKYANAVKSANYLNNLFEKYGNPDAWGNFHTAKSI